MSHNQLFINKGTKRIPNDGIDLNFYKWLPITQQRILDLLFKHKIPMIRGEIISKIGLPRTTVYDNLKALKIKMVIWSYTKSNGKRGRPPVFWYILRNHPIRNILENI